MSPLVEIRNLSKVYVRGKQKLEVLHHVNLDIPRGDFLALMGPSGSARNATRCRPSSPVARPSASRSRGR